MCMFVDLILLDFLSRAKKKYFSTSINVGNLFMHSLSVVIHDRKVVLPKSLWHVKFLCLANS